MGVDNKFYYTPAYIPSGENALTIVMQARGRYPLYQFDSRHVEGKEGVINGERTHSTKCSPSS